MFDWCFNNDACYYCRCCRRRRYYNHNLNAAASKRRLAHETISFNNINTRKTKIINKLHNRNNIFLIYLSLTEFPCSVFRIFTLSLFLSVYNSLVRCSYLLYYFFSSFFFNGMLELWYDNDTQKTWSHIQTRRHTLLYTEQFLFLSFFLSISLFCLTKNRRRWNNKRKKKIYKKIK